MNSPEAAPVDASGLGDLLGSIAYLRCLADLALFGLSAGLFSVPLYALIQQLTDRSRLGRVLGGLHFYAFLFLSLALAGADSIQSDDIAARGFSGQVEALG